MLLMVVRAEDEKKKFSAETTDLNFGLDYLFQNFMEKKDLNKEMQPLKSEIDCFCRVDCLNQCF